MKNLPLFLLGLICTLFATTASAQVTPEQARNFQINATHTGAISSEHLTPPLRLRWTVDFGWPVSYPLIADGKVFVTVKNVPITSGTMLYALDATNGATIWSFNLGGFSFWGAACYENGNVFALNGSGLLRSFDGATGNLNWSVQLPGQSSFSAPPTVLDGVIYVSGAGFGGTVYAVNANSGAVVWTAPVTSGDKSSPAVTSEGVYVSYTGPNVYKLDPATGAQIWTYPGGSGAGGRTPVLYNGALYARDTTAFGPGAVFDSQTGTISGSFSARNTPAFSGDTGFFLLDGSFLLARDLVTNSFLWAFTGDGFLQSAILVVNNHVYVGSSQGNLYAVDAATGQQVWTTNVGASIPSVNEDSTLQPLTGFAAAEGLLVVPTGTTLVAYEGDTAAPTLTFGNPTPTANAAGWNNTAVDISFTTADDLSGVQSTDPGSPLHFAAEGANQTQQVTVTDNAGNSATFTSPGVNIDFTQPATLAVIPGFSMNQEWFSGPVSVTLSASDNLSGVADSFYRVDGGSVQTYASPVSITSEGTHSLEYWSVDVAGNTETHHTRIVKIDATAPVTQVSVSGTAGTNGWYRSAVQVSLSATDNLSGVFGSFYRVNGGATQTYAGAFVLSVQGQHIVEYWSLDNLNNTEVTKTQLIKIDSVAPVVTASANPATAPKRPQPVNVTISGSATDAVSGILSAAYNVIDEYGVTQPSGSVTVQANGTYSFTLTLPATRNGGDKDGHLYTIVVSGLDRAGNSASATTTLRIN